MKLLADAHYGSSNVPDDEVKKIRHMDLEHLLPCLKPGAVIFVDTPSLEKFFANIYSKIKIPFVLISGDSDLSAPGTSDVGYEGTNSKVGGAMECQWPATALEDGAFDTR